MKLRIKGRWTVRAIDIVTGIETWRRTIDNEFTSDGLNYLATALTSGAGGNPNQKLKPANSALQCRVLTISTDTTGGFTSSGGPMTATQYVDPASRSVHSTVGTDRKEVEYVAPSVDLPIRLRWFDPSVATYALYGMQIRNGDTVLAAAAFSGTNADKKENEIIVAEWTATITEGSGVVSGGGGELTKVAGGFGSSGWNATVTTFDSTDPVATLGSISATDAVWQTRVRYANILAGQPSPEEIADKAVNGFDLKLGSVVIVAHAPGISESIPEANKGSLDWAVTLTIS